MGACVCSSTRLRRPENNFQKWVISSILSRQGLSSSLFSDYSKLTGPKARGELSCLHLPSHRSSPLITENVFCIPWVLTSSGWRDFGQLEQDEHGSDSFAFLPHSLCLAKKPPDTFLKLTTKVYSIIGPLSPSWCWPPRSSYPSTEVQQSKASFSCPN